MEADRSHATAGSQKRLQHSDDLSSVGNKKMKLAGNQKKGRDTVTRPYVPLGTKHIDEGSPEMD